MPREKFKTLTEQMFYILLCLNQECRGVDILEMVRTLTDGRVSVGSGTLYDLLELFVKEGVIRETKAEGRRRSYIRRSMDGCRNRSTIMTAFSERRRADEKAETQN